MTETPVTIDQGRPLSEAHALMRTKGIRHLPVMHGGRLVGLVSARDLTLIESLPDVDANTVPVEDAMSEDVYQVAPDAPLSMVAAEMAERKLGSAVVVAGGKVVGVFTAVDACRALALVLSLIAWESDGLRPAGPIAGGLESLGGSRSR